VELLDIASRQGSWIFEDDYNSEFHFRERPIAALRSLDFSGLVNDVGTFSKTLFPSLRLGYIVCPPGLREDLCKVKRLDDLGSPSVEQAALAAFMRSRQFEKYLRWTVVALQQCRTVFIDALRRHCGERIKVQDTHAGTHIVVWLQSVEYAQLARLIEIGIAHGLGLYAMHPYYRNPPDHPGLMLGYAGLSADALARAAELLGDCLGELEEESRGKRPVRAGALGGRSRG
jgi:GntR family transcriptional regulator/MocR family aminotransferase